MRATQSRSISELFDKCSLSEWEALTRFNQYHDLIKTAIELRSKELLDLQRDNMLQYVRDLISNVTPDPDQATAFAEIFERNRVDPKIFAQDLAKLLLKTEYKINGLRIWGVPNSCKTLIANCISAPFVCCYMNNHGSENEFFLSNMLNKAIIHCEELYVTPATAEDLKCVLAGQPMDVAKKFSEKQLLSRTPVLITSNHEHFGRNHLPPIDEQALVLRCFNYHFVSTYKPSVTLTWQQFYCYLFTLLPE